jgi:hypothetical protein
VSLLALEAIFSSKGKTSMEQTFAEQTCTDADAGMFIIIGSLLALEGIFSSKGADAVMDVFAPAINWIQRWLPLFYVPSLVIVPLALKGIAGVALKLFFF